MPDEMKPGQAVNHRLVGGFVSSYPCIFRRVKIHRREIVGTFGNEADLLQSRLTDDVTRAFNRAIIDLGMLTMTYSGNESDTPMLARHG